MNDVLRSWLFDPAVGKLIAAIISLLIVIGIVRFARYTLAKRIKSSENRYRVRKFVGFAGYILAAFSLTLVFSDELSGLTVFFGVLAGGVAFALQEVISSIGGWIALSFGNIYQMGDRVQLAGIKGDVIDIGVLKTTLMECGAWVNGDLYNGRIVKISNSFIFKEPVYNYSSDFPFLWDEIIVPIRYGSDYEFAKNEFQKILDDTTGDYAKQLKSDWRKMTDKYLLEDTKLAPSVSLNLNDNWAQLILRYVVDYKQRRTTRDKICMQVLESVENSNKKIILGASSLEITAAPAFQVNLKP